MLQILYSPFKLHSAHQLITDHGNLAVIHLFLLKSRFLKLIWPMSLFFQKHNIYQHPLPIYLENLVYTFCLLINHVKPGTISHIYCLTLYAFVAKWSPLRICICHVGSYVQSILLSELSCSRLLVGLLLSVSIVFFDDSGLSGGRSCDRK